MEYNDQVIQTGVWFYGRVRIVELEIGGEIKENPQNFAGSSSRAPVIYSTNYMFPIIRNSTPKTHIIIDVR